MFRVAGEMVLVPSTEGTRLTIGIPGTPSRLQDDLNLSLATYLPKSQRLFLVRVAEPPEQVSRRSVLSSAASDRVPGDSSCWKSWGARLVVT
jgi:hypothetical protein